MNDFQEVSMREEGYVIGWMFSCGFYTNGAFKNQEEPHVLFSSSKIFEEDVSVIKLKNILQKYGYDDKSTNGLSSIKIVRCENLVRLFWKYGLYIDNEYDIYNSRFNNVIKNSDDEFKKGMIDGILSSIYRRTGKDNYISIQSFKFNLCNDLSSMLRSFNISVDFIKKEIGEDERPLYEIRIKDLDGLKKIMGFLSSDFLNEKLNNELVSV